MYIKIDDTVIKLSKNIQETNKKTAGLLFVNQPCLARK